MNTEATAIVTISPIRERKKEIFALRDFVPFEEREGRCHVV
jgi:hypothetical protein